MSLAEAGFATAFPGLSVEDAFNLREGRDWRHIPANDPARFAHLLSTAVQHEMQRQVDLRYNQADQPAFLVVAKFHSSSTPETVELEVHWGEYLK